MQKRINIIVLESSAIIYEGLCKLMCNPAFDFNFHFANNLNELNQLNIRYNADLVIINPLLIQNMGKEFHAIQKEYNKTCWLALIYSHFDHQLLSIFDGLISINDTAFEINLIIKKNLLIENTSSNQPTQSESLSEREIDVLKLVVNGNANKEIADKLNISINTVISHRKNISQKTGIKSVSGLTIYAVVNNYISVDNM